VIVKIIKDNFNDNKRVIQNKGQKQDESIQKQDEPIQKQDEPIQKQDEPIQKQDEPRRTNTKTKTN